MIQLDTVLPSGLILKIVPRAESVTKRLPSPSKTSPLGRVMVASEAKGVVTGPPFAGIL